MKTGGVKYAFIDSQNLNLGVQERGWRLDFRKFRRYLQDKYGVNRAYLFIGYVSENQRLYTMLQEAGYVCIFKPTLSVRDKGSVKIKGNVDAELVLHTMIEYQNYIQAIIVSGDGDFYCLVEYLAKKEKLLHIMVPNPRYSSLLRRYSRYIVDIQLLKRKVCK